MATYDLLDSTTLTSSASSVTFSSISQGYRDLVLVASVIASAGAGTRMRLNSDSSSVYFRTAMNGDGTSATDVTSGPNDTFFGAGAGADPTLEVHQLMDYSATDKHTSVIASFSRPGSSVRLGVHRYASTSAITAIEYFGTSNFDSGSTFSLYGIAS